MKRFILFSFVLFLLAGCLTTVHPIFTEKDLVFNTNLLGKWKTKNNNDEGFAEITPLSKETTIELPGKIAAIRNKGYLVTYKTSGGNPSGQYIAFLARIGKHLYFDYFPASVKGKEMGDAFYMSHFVKMHTPYRVNIRNTGFFELSQLEAGYMNKLIEEKKIRISHETNENGDVVITASTNELQQYILKYGDDPEAVRSEKTIFSKLSNQ